MSRSCSDVYDGLPAVQGNHSFAGGYAGVKMAAIGPSGKAVGSCLEFEPRGLWEDGRRTCKRPWLIEVTGAAFGSSGAAALASGGTALPRPTPSCASAPPATSS